MQQQSGAPQAAAAAGGSSMRGRMELLCNVRGLLKKIKQSVLVGDRVQVTGIDWEDRRGGLPPTGMQNLNPRQPCCTLLPSGMRSRHNRSRLRCA